MNEVDYWLVIDNLNGKSNVVVIVIKDGEVICIIFDGFCRGFLVFWGVKIN